MVRDEGDSGRAAEHTNTEHRESYSAMDRHHAQPVSRSVLTTGAVIGVAALFQPELLVGMAVGAGIAMASNWLPDLVTTAVRPMVKTVIKAGYAAASIAQEMVSEATESVQDMVAEVRSENGSPQ